MDYQKKACSFGGKCDCVLNTYVFVCPLKFYLLFFNYVTLICSHICSYTRLGSPVVSATLVCIDRSCMSSDLMLNNPVLVEIRHFYNSVSYTNTS